MDKLALLAVAILLDAMIALTVWLYLELPFRDFDFSGDREQTKEVYYGPKIPKCDSDLWDRIRTRCMPAQSQ